MGAERHGGAAHAVFVLDAAQGLQRVGIAGPALREFAAGEEVVDVRQHGLETLVNGVDIHRNGDAVAPRDGRGAGHQRRVVAVDMQQARAADHLVGQVAGIDAQALRAVPDHRALAAALVDQNVRRLVGAIRAPLDVIQVQARAGQALPLNAAPLVVADRADITGAQAQAGAAHHGAGHLAAGTEQFRGEWDFAAVGREVRDEDQRVGGIQTDSHDIEPGQGRTSAAHAVFSMTRAPRRPEWELLCGP